jgi:hypothetical protein
MATKASYAIDEEDYERADSLSRASQAFTALAVATEALMPGGGPDA